MKIANPLVLDALKKSTYLEQNEFKNFIANNYENIFTSEVLSEGAIRIKSVIEGYWLGYKFPDRYTVSGELKNTSVTFKNSVSKEEETFNLSNEYIVSILLNVDHEKNLVPAFKEILWHFKNKPMTAKNILSYVLIMQETGQYRPISKCDYEVTNNAFQKAILDFDLVLIKEKIKDKWVYLYKNPTDKRKGYYYKGSLLSLKELSSINLVPVITIQKRISKGMPIHKAIMK